MLDKYRKANLANWEERVPLHVQSEMYGVDEFVCGTKWLSRSVEFDRQYLGDVRGRSLLHLQCHIGTDSLSWARLGANVTGIDFSRNAICEAKRISRACNVPARFVQSDVYDGPQMLKEKFDIVYSSVGSLSWLPSIAEWANVVSEFLEPGGVCYFRDGHPMLWAVDKNRRDDKLIVRNQYFESSLPLCSAIEGSYADKSAKIRNSRFYTWNHSIGEIVSALLGCGMEIESLKEYTFCDWKALSHMVQDDEGLYRLPRGSDRLPLEFSIKARLSQRDPRASTSVG